MNNYSCFISNQTDCSLLYCHVADYIQPQHLWPYIQQNLIQQNHFSIGNHQHHQPHHITATQTNGVNNGNCNNNENCLQQQHSTSATAGQQHQPQPNDVQEDSRLLARDNKIIAKPLPSRPTPFLPHGLNHPHLHTLLAHCRNPYLPGKLLKPYL